MEKVNCLSEQPRAPKTILIYNTMWGKPVEYPLDRIPDGFILSTDRSLMQQADAVLFHLPSLFDELDGDLEKPDGQLWIAWSRECEVNYPWTKHYEIAGLFDLWMGYHQHDDIIYPYYDASCISSFCEPVPVSDKQNKIGMFLSDSFDGSKRMNYLKELMRYIPIDSFGDELNNQPATNDLGEEKKSDLISKYKFTIAFENAIAPDYVTEQFFLPLLKGSVPIYSGAPNIADFAPGEHCFVDVRQFASPRLLADFIHSCYEDSSLYDSFFEWKKKTLLPSFVEKTEQQRIHPIVRLCLKVKDKLEEEERIKNSLCDLGDIFLCSFGDSGYSQSRERLIFQATSFGLFKDIFVYDEHELDNAFKERFKDQLQSGTRGYGYWVWKPYVILECLKKIKENDVLLYVDAGCHLNIRGKRRFIDYWSEVKKNESGFLVIELEADKCVEKKWTKGDLFDYFNVRDKTEITHTPQYQANVIFIRKEQQTVDLIKKWLDVFYFYFRLADNTPSISPNWDDFIEHRHDQSILSILLKQHGASLIPVNETYHLNWTILENKYPILTKRDSGGAKKHSKS